MWTSLEVLWERLLIDRMRGDDILSTVGHQLLKILLNQSDISRLDQNIPWCLVHIDPAVELGHLKQTVDGADVKVLAGGVLEGVDVRRVRVLDRLGVL